MILSKLGRRVAAFVLSVLLLSASVFPAFATSTSGQLQEVGWAETVSSFLMASGIYPFESDPETGYEEWSVSSLKALWDEFRDDTTQVAYDIVDLTGSLVKGVIAIASGRWSVLREFATWVVNKYDVQDNQTGIKLGDLQKVESLLPVRPDSTSTSVQEVVDVGRLLFLTGSPKLYVVSSVDDTYIFAVANSASSAGSVYTVSLNAGRVGIARTNGTSVSWHSYGHWTVDDVIYYQCSLATTSSISSFNGPLYSSYEQAVRAIFDSYSGITADTTTVSIPAPLPEGTDFGGLAVSGTGVAVTPEQLEEIVQNAVKEALKPSVAVVPVAISPDVSVNPSGEITVSGDVTIGSGNIPLQSSDYSAPNLTQVFPFSIPWDVLAVLNVLDAEPVRPEFNVDLYIPVLDVHVPWTIGVSEDLQEPVDNFMASMRLLLLVAMCVGTLWLFWRSNL